MILKILLSCSLFFPGIFAQHFLLQKPQSISQAEVEQLPRFWSATFGGRHCSANFLYCNGRSDVQFSGIGIETHTSALWEELAKSIEAIVPEEEREQEEYHIDTMRVIEAEKNTPQPMSIEAAAKFIAAHTVIFYTGAGISLAADVDDMGKLTKGLGMGQLADAAEYLQYLQTHEQEVLNYFTRFCNRAFTATPTKAHLAIAAIAQLKEVQIMTENFDFLHQRTGSLPYCITAGSLRKNVPAESLQAIDAVVCVGLSHDDRGFLGWYKRHHPQGTIIAFDTGMPNYLGPEDFLVKGDAQETLSALRFQLNFDS